MVPRPMVPRPMAARPTAARPTLRPPMVVPTRRPRPRPTRRPPKPPQRPPPARSPPPAPPSSTARPMSHWRTLILVALLYPAAARAGGYDTPMLYSARHIGMGGTAIGYVSDPSALFHNPAGLAQTGRFSVLGDF